MADLLETALLDGGLQFVNFFEGRILTGRDLRDEQAAAERARRRLGRAIGPGVAHGFTVAVEAPGGASTAPALRVSPGLAVAPDGRALGLSDPAVVTLARGAASEVAPTTGPFGPCAVGPGSVELPAEVGVFLLTVGPAEGFEEEAPKAGLDGGGAGGADGCGRRYLTQGVRFRLIRLAPSLLGADAFEAATIAALIGQPGAEARARLRNLSAFACLGAGRAADFAADPFARSGGVSAWGRWGALDQLAAGSAPALTACEVPLALLSWTFAGIGFLDMWGVRRRCLPPALDGDWPRIAAAARHAETDAMIAQFQGHLTGLTAQGLNATALRWLPPAGFLPMADAAARSFLGDIVAGPTIDLPAARLFAVIDAARSHPPVDIAAEQSVRLLRCGGSAGWRLFVAADVVLAEAEAARIAELDERVAALEAALEVAREGVVTGMTSVRYLFGGGGQEYPIPGVSVSATRLGDDDATLVTLSGADARYLLRLAAGTWRLRASAPGGSGVPPVERTVTVTGGETRTENLVFVIGAVG